MNKKEEIIVQYKGSNQLKKELINSKFENNELIESKQYEIESTLLTKKLELLYLSEILDVIKIEKKIKFIEKIEEINEKIKISLNKVNIFELFFSIKSFTSNLSNLLDLIKLFPCDIDKQIKTVISKKKYTKEIRKLIVKNASFFDNYIEKETLFELNRISIENTFAFYLNQYKEGKNRLINLYNLFKDNKNIINKLVDVLRNRFKKEKQAELIEQDLYDEEKEYELEEKEIVEKKTNRYFVLPDNYKKYYISAERHYMKKSEKMLDELINSNNDIPDEYLGIDTEWKSYNSFLELYDNNLNDSNKNKGISGMNKSNLSDIIQISGKNYGLIIDTKSIYKNCKIRNKIKQLLSKKKFIGFGFGQDEKKIGGFFKDIIITNINNKKNNFIELSNVYEKIKKKKVPKLSEITFELFGKELDKRDQLSDWSKKPLLSSQINYGLLDAYILILIYNKLNGI